MSELMKHVRLLADFDRRDYQIERGPAMYVHPSLDRPGFYPPEATLDTDYGIAYRERILEAMNQGLICSGRFNDRKMRFAGMDVGDTCVLRLGPTHYYEAEATNVAASKDPSLWKRFVEDGEKIHGNRLAYLANMIATDTVLVSEEGHVTVLLRSEEMGIYPGHWSVVCGLTETDFSFWEKPDPTQAFKELIHWRGITELRQETRVNPSEVRLTQTGLTDSLAVYTFSSIAHSTLPSEEIMDRIPGAEDSFEHSDSQVLKTNGEIHDFLTSDQPISPLGLGAILLYLRKTDPDTYRSLLRNFTQFPIREENTFD